jgi:hypothetical protein
MRTTYVIEHASRGVYMGWGTASGADKPSFGPTKGRSEGRVFLTVNDAVTHLTERPGWPEGCYVLEMPGGKVVFEPGVVCTTEIRRTGVHYAVRKRGELVWERFVKFGKMSIHRAGGYAFREAAKEQERQAGPTFVEIIGRAPEDV